MSKLDNHTVHITGDGSKTFFSKKYNELCHSEAGAVKETQTHYIIGCEVEKFLNNQTQVNILEVGFGTGLGFLETKKLFKNIQKKLVFVSFEIDLELIQAFEAEQNIIFKKNGNIFSYQDQNIQLKVFLGNARNSISQIPKDLKFNCIYQDAFSPKRNSVLWTTQWFEALKGIASENCILSTYSASSSIRKSMYSAGWEIFEGENFGNKRSSTRGKLTGSTSKEIIQKLERSPVPAITDENYLEYTLENYNEKN